MIKEGKIGVQEAISLIAITITVKVFFTSPAYTAKVTGTASWYMTLISATTASLGFMILYLLLKRFPGKDLVQVFELSMGRIVGFIFSILVCIVLFIDATLLVREFAEVMKVYVLPLSPPSSIIGVFLAMVIVVCFLGLESIARFSRLFGYFLVGGFLIIIVLATNKYDYHYLFPFWGYGFDKTLTHGVSRSSFYGEVIILGVIAAAMQGTAHIKKAGLAALIVSGLIISLGLSTTMMAFDYSTAQEITSRMYDLTRIIHLGGFFERLDPIFLFTWNIGTLVGVSTLFYASLSIYCKTFRIQDMRPIIIPKAIILFTVSMIPQDLTSVSAYVHILREYGWIIFYCLPLAALITAMVRRKKGGAVDA